MKRLFPWIFVLITLSLAGIIFIQFNWIRSAISMRKDQYDQRMLDALSSVRDDIVNDKHPDKEGGGTQAQSRFNNSMGGFLPGFSPQESIPVPFRYTLAELHQIIGQNLRLQGFDIPFQFAVISKGPLYSAYELRTSD
ncbi:MAG: hypothetical protein ACRDE2_16190, partial [Chitinophagaceae bacterium]